ncbi:hypothetical protein GCM10023163_21720 [Aestuariibaculum suncheonense]
MSTKVLTVIRLYSFFAVDIVLIFKIECKSTKMLVDTTGLLKPFYRLLAAFTKMSLFPKECIGNFNPCHVG